MVSEHWMRLLFPYVLLNVYQTTMSAIVIWAAVSAADHPFLDGSQHSMTKPCLYNFDPLKPHFYIEQLGFTGVYIIFLFFSAQKYRLWVLVRTASSRRVPTIYV